MNFHIPHSKPYFDIKEKNALSAVISSGQVAAGKHVAELEKTLALSVGHTYGIAVSCGTAALYLALRALHVQKNDFVIIPSYVCTAVLNAVVFAQAQPVLCDIDLCSGLLCLDSVKKVLRPRVKAIIVPHLFGNPVDITPIESLGIPVVEDCAQCIGTTVNNRKVGSQSCISVFSFYATKIIAAGEGGCIATSDSELAENIIDFLQYDNRQNYIPRFNFKLSDLHAAVALQQVYKLKSIIQKRRSIAQQYIDILSEFSSQIILPETQSNAQSMYYRFIVRVLQGSQTFIKAMGLHGIVCTKPIFKPIHLYLKKGKGFKNTELFYRQAVSIPCYPALTKQKIIHLLTSFQKILR